MSGLQHLAQGGKAARKHISVLTERDLSLLFVKLCVSRQSEITVWESTRQSQTVGSEP